MTRLPTPLMPLWPAAKRLHRLGTRAVGLVTRHRPSTGPLALPRTASPSVAQTERDEPEAVTVHGSGAGPIDLVRAVPVGTPDRLAFWDDVTELRRPERSVLEVRGGRLVGETAVTITPGGRLDLDTSPYFGIKRWTEHPLYLRWRLPEAEHVEGTLLSLASHASGRNYYHSLMDTLPRWGLYQQVFDGALPDRVVVAGRSAWDRQLVVMAGLEDLPRVEPDASLSLTANRLLVPSLDNQGTLAPPWVTRWLRENLPARPAAGGARRLYVSRGSRPNTRRYVQEAQLLTLLERQGFERFDPGAVTVQEQIDAFAAAEVVVAPHGAGLVNLNFAPAGVRVLELFAPRYLNPSYWSITDNVEDSVYRYLVADPVDPRRPDRRMQGLQDDIDLDPDRVLGALEELLAA